MGETRQNRYHSEAEKSRDESDGAAERGSRLKHAFAQLRVKLTLPYIFLALVVAFAAAYLVTSLLVGVLDDRFQSALLDAGKEAADTVVRIEREQLAVWRLISYTEGFAEQVAEGEGEAAGLFACPLIVNEHLDSMEVLDANGNSLLAMHHLPGGGPTDYDFVPNGDYEWDMVQRVLAGGVDEYGDKYADLISTDQGWVFYTAGPIKLEGDVVGVLLVGTYLDRLVQRLGTAALARTSVYVAGEPPVATTLAAEERHVLALDDTVYQTILTGQEDQVLRRDVQVAERDYVEILGAFEARYGRDLGVLSVAMPLSFVTDSRHPTREYLLALFGLATVTVLVVGAVVASRVVQRVRQLAAATRQVAQGDLSTQVELRGYDEVATLASDFNRMVVQLKEGRLYRDLLGLTSSPEVAKRLHDNLKEGRLQLEAQSMTATVLFCDIRDFTSIAENREPQYIIDFFNEYMQGIVTVIRDHDGVVNKFVGDAALAFFGILPETCQSDEGARNAVAAALGMLDYLEEFNRQRQEQGEDPIRIGVGVNTGMVVAGTMGSEERLEYTVLGDTVNVAHRLSDMNKEYAECDVFVSADTYQGLDEELQNRARHMGETKVKGRTASVDVYGMAKE